MLVRLMKIDLGIHQIRIGLAFHAFQPTRRL